MNRERINKISDAEIIEALRKAATYFNHEKFTRHEFDKVSNSCKGTVVLSRFGTWSNALAKTDLQLKERPKQNREFISEQELMEEMERVLNLVGQRPSKAEWEASNPKYSYTTYKTRFSGWVAAWEHFYTNYKGQVLVPNSIEPVQPPPAKIRQEQKRDIPLKLRLKVFQRDSYKCVLCGASPAINSNIQLHVDHIHPFSRGGKTEIKNLQTLCQNCNWGKGNET